MAAMFECDQCDYKSKTKSALILHHNSLHNMVKQKCLNCGSQFSTKGNIMRHVGSMHEGKKYPCDSFEYITNQKRTPRGT